MKFSKTMSKDYLRYVLSVRPNANKFEKWGVIGINTIINYTRKPNEVHCVGQLKEYHWKKEKIYVLKLIGS